MKTIQLFLLAFVMLLKFSEFSFAANCTALSSGNWSNPTIWSCGALPGCGDIIVIPSGIIVSVDMQVDLDENSSPACSTATHIQISGVLQFVTGNKISLACGSSVEVMPGGAMLPGGGGGSSNWLKICAVTEWKTSDGPVVGYKLFGSPSPLPVDFVSFNVIREANVFRFNWLVASERNNDHFTVEYSQNGNQWQGVLELKSIGDHSGNYMYTVDEIKNIHNNGTILYFRLKQTDVDGKVSILDQKSVENEKNDFTLYPNPTSFGDAIHMKINASTALLADVYFYNALGQLVDHKMSKLEKGLNTLTFDQLNLKRGVYIIKIPSVQEDEFFRLIIE